MSTGQPRLDESATPKTVTIKPRAWDFGDMAKPFDVTLRAVRYSDSEWAVFDGETYVGVVGRYQGTIDTKIKGTRLRRQGVRRTLWYERKADSRYTFYEQVSRADCIRRLVESARRR